MHHLRTFWSIPITANKQWDKLWVPKRKGGLGWWKWSSKIKWSYLSRDDHPFSCFQCDNTASKCQHQSLRSCCGHIQWWFEPCLLQMTWTMLAIRNNEINLNKMPERMHRLIKVSENHHPNSRQAGEALCLRRLAEGTQPLAEGCQQELQRPTPWELCAYPRQCQPICAHQFHHGHHLRVGNGQHHRYMEHRRPLLHHTVE